MRGVGQQDQVDAAGERQCGTRRSAGSGRPGGRRPATTSTRCRRPGSGRAGRARRRAGPAATLSALPVGDVGVERPAGRVQRRIVVVASQMPTNTPVRLPARRSARMPASSSASQATSSSSRCCGSMRAASRGEMPKKRGVEPVDVGRGSRPSACRSCRGAPGADRRTRRRPSGRRGTSVIASTPSRSSCQKLAGPSAPPGKRQPMPTMAIGSGSGEPAMLRRHAPFRAERLTPGPWAAADLCARGHAAGPRCVGACTEVPPGSQLAHGHPLLCSRLRQRDDRPRPARAGTTSPCPGNIVASASTPSSTEVRSFPSIRQPAGVLGDAEQAVAPARRRGA